jgi:phosphatidylserine/phosphatidylglycerophosphate/cardiolipin synthase-like enzyme
MDFVAPARPVAVSLVAGRGHYERVVRAVLEARRSVWIATANVKELYVEDPGAFGGALRPGVARAAPGAGRARAGRGARGRGGRGRGDAYRSVLSVFDDLAARGVELRMLHAGFPSRAFRDELEAHPRLLAGGLQLRACPRVHLKAVIVDARLLYIGSANWTGAGLGAKGEGRRNFELGLVTEDDGFLDEIQGMFDHVWRGAACAGCRVRAACDAPLDERVDARALVRPERLLRVKPSVAPAEPRAARRAPRR